MMQGNDLRFEIEPTRRAAANATAASVRAFTVANALPRPSRKKLRGRDKLEHDRTHHPRGQARQERTRARIAKRLAQCQCCGANVFDAEGKPRTDVRWRTVGAWRVQLCDQHDRVGWTSTLIGTLRVYELPPETKPTGG